ncbi:outer dense fiber protein 2 isoform X3 [Patella vulgata]|uniref:outer dense fiber protein 2 isoform X3 n=1 Tax=Patella vulgata TaxID=6465 RepID=UPI00217F510F|nr:outer dense fiber protein 2 isoform X3 [Patella vulgata]
MTVENGLRPTSPVHVHVDDDIPVHVHVKKTKSKKSRCTLTQKKKSGNSGGPIYSKSSSNTCQKVKPSSARARSRSPGGGPWVPPPGKTTRGSKLAWQGPTYRLEIPTGQDRDQSNELSTDEEDKVHGQMRSYEKKIDGLMSEVGTLKNEVDLQKALHEIEKRDDLLNSSQRVIDKQDDEIQTYQDELNATEAENRILRQNVDILKGDPDLSRDTDFFTADQEKLMKKLIEVEMDGQAVAQQIRETREVIRRLKDTTQSEKFTKQKDLLLEKLADFEATNRVLRRLLREQHSHEAATLRLGEQRDLLMKKLSDTDRANERMRCELMDRERMMVELHDQITEQKNEIGTLTNLQGTLESTRGHLQKQLRTKDSDCNRMAVQIRTLESSLAQNTIEMEHLQHLVNTSKERSDKDKEALKKATRAQKQRAERSEDALDKLNAQLSETEAQVIEYKSMLDQNKGRSEKITKERQQAISENTSLRKRINELEGIVDQLEDNNKTKNDDLSVKLSEKTADVASLKIENERLKMHKSRREADDSMVKLEEQQLETGRVQKDSQQELEKVKVRLHQRLKELDPLPELLRSTESKLHEANERLLMYEIKNTENTKIIAELTSKVEHTSDSQSSVRSKLHETQDENRAMISRMDSLERKFREAEDQVRELASTVSKREETIHQNNLRLEEKSRENASLTRQLENALADNRRQNEENRERYNSKERTYQSRIVDLETQISQLRTEIARIKREKEENERKFNSRLYDLKDRLEQCHSTNRSMQNYVHFLKNSYANVFGDTAVGLPPTSPIRSVVP